MSAALDLNREPPERPRGKRGKKLQPVSALSNERLQLLADALSDFAAFCGLLDIIPKDGTGSRPFVLNHIQRIFNIDRTGRDIVLKPRQIGFSTLELARDVWHFLTVPGASVLVICQAVDGDGPLNNLTGIVSDYFDSLERAGLHLDFEVKRTHDWQIIGPDGSRAKLVITTAPATEKAAKKLGRSGTVTRLHCTETSVWEYDELAMNAVLECVPKPETGSEIVIESTAHGSYGFFHRYCMGAAKGQLGYKLHFYPWFYHAEYAVPIEDGEVVQPSTEREKSLAALGVTPEQLKWYRRKVAEKTQDLTDQEYPSDPDTCFLVSGRSFFDRFKVNTMIANDVRNPLDLTAFEAERARELGPKYAAVRQLRDLADIEESEEQVRGFVSDLRIRIFERPEIGVDYVIGSDTSSGAGKDASSGIIHRRDTGAHVATLDGQYEPHQLARALAMLGLEYNTALIAVERENHGQAVLQELHVHLNYPNLYVHSDGKLGHPTNPVTRPVMLDDLQKVLTQELWSTPDRALLAQMRTFIVGPNEKPQAAPGTLDDLVLGAAIAWAIRCMPANDLSVGGVTRRRSAAGAKGRAL